MGLWAITYAYVTFVLGDAGWGARTLARVAFGWNVLGSWGIGVGVWVVWFPAWLVAALLGLTQDENDNERGEERAEKPNRERRVEAVKGATSRLGKDW